MEARIDNGLRQSRRVNPMQWGDRQPPCVHSGENSRTKVQNVVTDSTGERSSDSQSPRSAFDARPARRVSPSHSQAAAWECISPTRTLNPSQFCEQGILFLLVGLLFSCEGSEQIFFVFFKHSQIVDQLLAEDLVHRFLQL